MLQYNTDEEDPLNLNKEKVISIPENVLDNYLSKEEIVSLTNGDTGIISVTVSAKK